MALTDNAYIKWMEMSLADATTQTQQLAKFTEIANILTYASITPTLTGYPTGFVLSTAQTGSADSTNKYDFGSAGVGGENIRQGGFLRVTTTVGATPTCTYTIKGSVDNATYFNMTYSDSASPTTFVSSTFVTTTATTVVKYIKPGQVFRYLKITYSSNTNVTNTADFYALGD